MRSVLIGLLTVCGLAAFVAPALACPYHDQSAQSGQTEQTAQAQTPSDAGSN